MRYLPDVIDEIVAVAPDLGDALRSTKESAQYSAPEMARTWWNQAARILNEAANGYPRSREIRRIFAGKK